ncbi:transglutaminase-like domain-containing protein [Paenibacillus sp. 1P07SE]|uniref:transglutaminase-like domain-containing protein n=1 Tax=Paenibacillus sp. 1P07SE TaxID=3132209 RepID=UPI0039A69B7A
MRGLPEPSADEHHVPWISGAGDSAEHDAPPSLGFRLLTSALLFGLLCEWVLPLRYLSAWTDLTRVDVVMGAVAFALASGCVVLSWRKLPFVLAFGLIVAVPWLFYGIDGIGSWLPNMVSILRADLQSVLARQWILSAELRTGVLLAGCMALSCAIQSLMWLRYWGAGLALATGLFLLQLEWWFGHDAMLPLVRVVCIGGLLTVALTCCRRSGNRATAYLRLTEPRRELPLQGLGAGALAVALLLGTGWWAASDRPAAPSPAPWAAGLQEQGEAWLLSMAGRQTHSRASGTSASDLSGRFAQIGYGGDDSRLGAPLAMNDSIVFIADTTTPVAYWRGEAKPFYDGRGWSVPFEERLESPLDRSFAEDRTRAAAGASGTGVEGAALSLSDAVRVRLTYADPDASLPLFTGGADTRVLQLRGAADGQASLSYRRDLRTDSLFPGSERAAVAAVELEFRSRTGTPNRPAHGQEHAAPAEIGSAQAPALTDALQLPVSVTERTAELARDVAAPAGSDDYARAAAIERYLQENYRYTLDDTSVPPQGQDFVDHFLFEQQAGYCVHFASAMTIMLRTLDIPARWVKGFASPTLPLEPGELAASTTVADELTAYAYRAHVRQRDAHAWVEVYIAGSGWVAFDPTPPAGWRTVAAAAETAAIPSEAGYEATGPAKAWAGRFSGRVWYAAERLGVWTIQRVASGLRQAAERMQPVIDQAERTLADIGAGSVRAAGVAALVLAGGLALSAAAVLGWRRRDQLALGWALRGYDRSCRLGRPTRRRLLTVIGRALRQVERTHGVRPPSWSGREYASSLALRPAAASALMKLICLEEEARFAVSYRRYPEPELLRKLLAELRSELAVAGSSGSLGPTIG